MAAVVASLLVGHPEGGNPRPTGAMAGKSSRAGSTSATFIKMG